MKTIQTTILLCLLMTTNSIAQISGNALHFDGENDYVICDLPFLFNDIASNDFTIEMWINPENQGSSRLVSAQVDADNFVSINLVPYVSPSPGNTSSPLSNIIFNVYENSVNHSVAAVGNIPYGVWSHVAVTWDASEKRAYVFVNGSGTTEVAGVFESMSGSNSKLTIGSLTDGEEVYKGQLDEVTIWKLAKSECEIASNIYNAHVTGPNTAAYYNFNNGIPSGYNAGFNSVIDFATYSYATLSGFSLNGNSSNWILSGVETYGWLNDPLELILNGDVLKPNKPAEIVRWIDCNTNTLIPNASSLEFYPPTDDPNYSPQTGGFYSVILGEGNCQDTSDCFAYGTNSLNDESILENQIYPNPNNGKFSLDLPSSAEVVQVLSLTGQLIKEKEVSGLTNVQFDLPHLNGVYLIRVSTELTSYVTKASILKP